ncbi:MAG TPA: MAPEG family protein [Allosphingosinicella sp.]
MTTELHVLAWGCILALVHIFAAVRVKTQQYGTKWNTGARDEALPPPDKPIVGRLARAQANFFETFPLYAAGALIVVVAHLNNRWTAIGALLWIAGRVVYLPLYALGVPVARTIAFLVSLAGIIMVLRPALMAVFH